MSVYVIWVLPVRTWGDAPTYSWWEDDKISVWESPADCVTSATQERNAQLTQWGFESKPGLGKRFAVSTNRKGKDLSHFHCNFMQTCASEGCSAPGSPGSPGGLASGFALAQILSFSSDFCWQVSPSSQKLTKPSHVFGNLCYDWSFLPKGFVFPQFVWVLEHFQLWEERAELLAGRTITHCGSSDVFRVRRLMWRRKPQKLLCLPRTHHFL